MLSFAIKQIELVYEIGDNTCAIECTFINKKTFWHSSGTRLGLPTTNWNPHHEFWYV